MKTLARSLIALAIWFVTSTALAQEDVWGPPRDGGYLTLGERRRIIYERARERSEAARKRQEDRREQEARYGHGVIWQMDRRGFQYYRW